MASIRAKRLLGRLRPTTHPRKCAIPGCGRLAMMAAGVGLAPFHCRKHVEHRARHGSHWHGTYPATVLKPYIVAAASYIRANRSEDRFISAAVDAVRMILQEAGPVEIATRLKGMSAIKRARIAIGRLRVAGTPPERIVSIVLGVSALIEDDPMSHRTKEFRTVQICKAVHRLASGTHKVWELEDHQGRRSRTELHAYPRSSGRVLRIMGRILEEPCEWVVEKHLAGVLAHKARHGRRAKTVSS